MWGEGYECPLGLLQASWEQEASTAKDGLEEPAPRSYMWESRHLIQSLGHGAGLWGQVWAGEEGIRLRAQREAGGGDCSFQLPAAGAKPHTKGFTQWTLGRGGIFLIHLPNTDFGPVQHALY